MVRADFLPRLAAAGEADAAPQLMRLTNYLNSRQHAQPPPGRELPERDESSQRKAS